MPHPLSTLPNRIVARHQGYMIYQLSATITAVVKVSRLYTLRSEYQYAAEGEGGGGLLAG